MMRDGWGMGGGWGWLLWLLVLLGLVLLVVVALRAVGGTGSRPGDTGAPLSSAVPGRSRARELLDERYARGEISSEEYRERRQGLERTEPLRRTPRTGG